MIWYIPKHYEVLLNTSSSALLPLPFHVSLWDSCDNNSVDMLYMTSLSVKTPYIAFFKALSWVELTGMKVVLLSVLLPPSSLSLSPPRCMPSFSFFLQFVSVWAQASLWVFSRNHLFVLETNLTVFNVVN